MSSQQKNLQPLIAVCQQIARDEQQVSVALLRAKAPMKVSISDAIEAVRAYQASESSRKSSSATSKDRVGQLENRVSDLEIAVAAMEKRLAALLTQKS